MNLINFKILYVEDDNTHREQLKIFLKRRVGKLYIASNGEEGLISFKSHRPDIVISDLKMPIMDGLEMSRKIREIDSKCAIIITTAFSDVETILNAVDLRIDKYVLKPINTDELMETVQKSALRLAGKKSEELVLGDKIITDKKEKLDYEAKLQTKMAHFIKSNSGKGPKIVKAFLKNNFIELEVHDALTVYEKKLLEKEKNQNLVIFSREAFYNDRRKELEKLFAEILDVKCTLEKVTIDLENNKDLFIFSSK